MKGLKERYVFDIFKVLGKLFQICAPLYFNENFK